MNRGRLLNIESHELRFRFELHREAHSGITLTNISRNHVAFKISTTNPDRYIGRPSIGVLSPGSTSRVQVTMLGPEEVPFDMQCHDTFVIKSVIARPDTTREGAQRLFTEGGRDIEAFRLRVVYDLPQHQVPQQQDEDWFHFDGFTKGIAIVVILLIFQYLMLPFIWSIIVMTGVLVIKVVNQVVAGHVEDWIVKIIATVIISFFTMLFQRREAERE